VNRRTFLVTFGSVIVATHSARARQGQKEKPDAADLKTVTLVVDGMT
jgi:hypothetical protein